MIKDILDYVANSATIIALIFAGYQFTQWKKQQRYSLEVSTLLDMEDKFEIYIMFSMKIYAGFSQARIDAEKFQSKEDKERLNEFFKGEFSRKMLEATKELNQAGMDYALYYFRAKRLNLKVEETDELNPVWLDKELNSFIEKNQERNEVATRFAEIKKIALERFEVLRAR